MKKRMAKAGIRKPARVTYELIPEDSEIGAPMYARLAALIEAHHRELLTTHARIALAWCTSWRPDVDGHITIGKCKKSTALDRELHAFDFVILLNREFWLSPHATTQYRDAVLDHELMHASVSYDDAGEPKVDAKGRVQFRIRKHDLEEFRDVVARHGCYRVDIEDFMKAVRRAEAGSQGWIGYTRLSELLATIGLTVSPRAIAAWSDDDRRRVHTFALLMSEAGERVNIETSQAMPPCLAEVVRPAAASH